MSAAADILAGELSDIRRALKRTWCALSVARLPIVSTDRVSGCIDRAIDQTTEAVHVLEVAADAPAGMGAPPPAGSISTVVGQLDDARRAIRRARQALPAPYLDGFLDRATDQTSAAIRALKSDTEAGIAWWNSCTERERAHWCKVASSAVPADAWEAYKRA